ncbi:hypothetical protein [Cereibacter changlensis]|uniref:hypothetical protein n=1 Tax=Cereibacter changlensis TaxID=402884 RepID=UPI004034BA28
MTMPKLRAQSLGANQNHSVAEQREDEDLAAQKLAAKSAYMSFWLAMTQTIVAIFGTGALFYSLRLNRIATSASEKAVEASIESNKIAMKAADAQTRPFLLLDTGKIELCISRSGYLANISVRFPIKNFGNTPAYDPNIAMNIWGHTARGKSIESDIWRTPLMRHSGEKGMSIGPQEHYSGIWTSCLVDASLIPEEQRRKEDRLIPHDAQFSGHRIFDDDNNYPIAISADILFSYLDMSGNQRAQEYYRLDGKVEGRDSWSKVRVLKVKYDPQGAGDIYPIY